MQRPMTPNDGVARGSSDVNPPQLELESGNGPTAKLTVVFVVVLFYMVTK